MWTNIQFWEAMFYCDVQNHIRALYLEGSEEEDEGGQKVRCWAVVVREGLPAVSWLQTELGPASVLAREARAGRGRSSLRWRSLRSSAATGRPSAGRSSRSGSRRRRAPSSARPSTTPTA